MRIEPGIVVKNVEQKVPASTTYSQNGPCVVINWDDQEVYGVFDSNLDAVEWIDIRQETDYSEYDILTLNKV